MTTETWVNIGSGDGLLPDGTNPLSEPMLTDNQRSPVTFILRQFYKSCLNYHAVTKIHLKITYLKFHSNQHFIQIKLTHPPGQNGCPFAQTIYSDAFFLDEKFCILIKISLKFVPNGPIHNNPALVQKLAWLHSIIWTNVSWLTEKYMRR